MIAFLCENEHATFFDISEAFPPSDGAVTNVIAVVVHAVSGENVNGAWGAETAA